MASTLLVIPARAGSKTIRRKNVRLLNGRPLIAYAIRTALEVPDADVVVSSDDPEILLLATRYGVPALPRPAELAGDDIPLDPVLYDALGQMETDRGRYQWAGTVQPTSPFLTARSIVACRQALEDGADTALTVRDARALHWRGEPDGPFRPESLINRQYLPKLWTQTGGCVLSRREVIQPAHRYGARCRLIPVSGAEAVDIDAWDDWMTAEAYSRRRRVAYRVDGGGALGLGHVGRALTLIDAAPHHDISLYMDENRYPDGVRLARERFADVRPHTALAAERPDILILEGYETTEDEVRTAQDAGAVVVTIEDRGPGSEIADLTFNDLDGPPTHGPQRFQGPRYAVLRSEFASVPAPRPIADEVRSVLVTFGGTDPGNLTGKALAALREMDAGLAVAVIRGPGNRRELRNYAGRDVTIIDAPTLMSEYMLAADLAITSAGRTVLELIRCQTPTIALCQNANEVQHASAGRRYGVVNLGYGPTLSVEDLAAGIRGMLPKRTRAQFRHRMAQVDLGRGAERFWHEVDTVTRAREVGR